MHLLETGKEPIFIMKINAATGVKSYRI